MGGADSHVAKLWRNEFEKHDIGYDEIVVIGNNLGELDRPEFIPNVFQLIKLYKKTLSERDEIKNALPQPGYYREMFTPKTDEEVKEIRRRTDVITKLSIASMRSMLNRNGE